MFGHSSSPPFLSPKAPEHIFRKMGIGSMDVCGVSCLEVLLQFGVLCCDGAAVFDGGRKRYSTCVVLGYSGVSRSSTQQPVSCFDTITLCRAWTQQGCHVLDTTAVYRVLRCSRERRGVVGLAGLTSRLPGHNVVRYVPGGVAPSAPQSKSDHEV